MFKSVRGSEINVDRKFELEFEHLMFDLLLGYPESEIITNGRNL